MSDDDRAVVIARAYVLVAEAARQFLAGQTRGERTRELRHAVEVLDAILIKDGEARFASESQREQAAQP